MNNTLLLDVQSKDISIALMENNTLVEFSKEPRDMSFSVGDIFLAKVKKIMPGLNAPYRDWETDRKSTRLNSSHITRSRMPSSA